MAKAYAKKGFRMLKIKGGMDAADDVNRVKAIHRALPDHILRLDADGGYSVKQALEVARALDGEIEMLEQPVTAEDFPLSRSATVLAIDVFVAGVPKSSILEVLVSRLPSGSRPGKGVHNDPCHVHYLQATSY